MATREDVDLKLNDAAGYYDISIGSTGDFELTDALDTSLLVSFFAEQRADESEVAEPENRRGWWGNLFSTREDFEIGSKLWLLYQSTNSQLTLNNAIDYTRKAYQWLLTYNYADDVVVTGTQSTSTLSITVKIIKDSDVITQKTFDLWENTFNLAASS